MSWQQMEGHDEVVEQFRSRFAAGRVTGTFLFVGPRGIGKRTFALRLAQALLCSGGRRATLDPCGVCDDCAMMAAGTHPDLLTVAKPPDKSVIPLALLIGPDENRMREGLCHDIGLKPFRGGRRIAIIDDADDFNNEGANALLKTLEEPPPKSVLILIGTSADQQLPTIRSRAQLIRFRPLPDEVAARLILARGLAATTADADRLAAAAGGSLERAERLAEPDTAEFRRALIAVLGAGECDWPAVAKLLTAYADEAGKDAPLRRERLRRAFGFLIEFYRQVVHASVGGPPAADSELQQAAERAARILSIDAETIGDVVDRALEAIEQVDRNAHYLMVVEALCDDAGQRLRGRAANA